MDRRRLRSRNAPEVPSVVAVVVAAAVVRPLRIRARGAPPTADPAVVCT